ncbi:MAG: DUF6321 domain-containing protein [Bacteroidota bacterium]|jgi:hypothetical protein
MQLISVRTTKEAKDDFQFKAKHKNPEGGLSEAGRKAYNRATGGNLKRPQPEGGSRRDSFCARMKGMKKKLTSKETARDPDSRINKALRKWKCSHVLDAAIKLASKPGLWANIHAKRKRGEPPAKPGQEDYPDAKNWKKVTEESEKEAAGRCWKGYEPVPGVKARSKGSCRPISAGKKKTEKKADDSEMASKIMNIQQFMGQNPRRELSEEETKKVEDRKRSLLPTFFPNYSDSPSANIYSPILPTLGFGGVGAGLGAILGSALSDKKNKGLGAGAGALGLGGAMALIAYLKRKQENANIEEIMRRLPRGATLRDYEADPLVQKNQDRQAQMALMAALAAR